jgi:CRP-like cAMP-binding protein
MRTAVGTKSPGENHDERIRILSSFGWLADMSPGFREAVIAEGRWKKLVVGDRITTAGDVKAELIVLAEGVATLTSGVGYAETPLIHVFRPPFWFGYAFFVGSGPRRFTTTMRSGGWTMSINGHRLGLLLDKEPGGWPSVVRLAMRYGDLAATIGGDLVIRESERRVIAVLLRCSGHRDPAEGPPLRNVPITQSELADATNLSRNSIVAILQELASRELVELNRGFIGIRDPSGLLSLLENDHWRSSPATGRPRRASPVSGLTTARATGHGANPEQG